MDISLRRIMVPIDFSNHSLTALKFARTIASQFDAEIELVHVVERSPYEVYQKNGFQKSVPFYEPFGAAAPTAKPDIIIRDLLEETRNQLRDLMDRKEKFQVEVRHGHVAEELLCEIDHYRPDLVVVCTHGWTGLKHLVMGSVAEKLVRLSPARECPAPCEAPPPTASPHRAPIHGAQGTRLSPRNEA
jgi:nucleotide-binding universal stress UspA family protein